MKPAPDPRGGTKATLEAIERFKVAEKLSYVKG